MKKFQKGILLAATKDSAFTLGTMLVNIKAKMPCVEVFYIVHNGFSEKDQKAMRQIASQELNDTGGGHCEFIYFDEEIFLQKLAKFGYFYKTNAFLQRYSFMAYACFETLLLLDKCENIIYLDFDILLLESIEELFFLKASLAANFGLNSIGSYLGEKSHEFAHKRIIRTGIIAFNDKLKNPKNLYDFIYKQSAKEGFLNDQLVFSLMIYYFKIQCKNLPSKTYVGLVNYRNNRKAKIIHAHGAPYRFWNNELTKRLFPQWQSYYEIWLQNGGSAYTKGLRAKTTWSVQRVRWHLSYKLGYAMIEAYQCPLKFIPLPFKLLYIALYHRFERKIYESEIKTKPHLKLPPLKEYEDYEIGAKEFDTLSYKLGKAFIKAHKSWYKGGYFFFFKEALQIKKNHKQKSI